MARRHGLNEAEIIIPVPIATGVADGTKWLFTLPRDIFDVVSWVVTTYTAGTGTALVTMTLQQEDNTDVSASVSFNLDSTAGTSVTSNDAGPGVAMVQGEAMELDLNFDAGTATGQAQVYISMIVRV
jgi:hypothetical protein